MPHYFHLSGLITAYDNHGVSKTFDDSLAVGLKNASEKLNFQVRLLNQPKPTQQGETSIPYAQGVAALRQPATRPHRYFIKSWRTSTGDTENCISTATPVLVTHYKSAPCFSMKGPTWVDSCQPGLILVMVAKKRQLKASLRKPAAAYDLSAVREILSAPEPNVEWRRNQKSKIDYRRLGLTKDAVYSILRGLRPNDFYRQSILERAPGQPAADVYRKHVRLPCCGDLHLYIKFLIENSSLLVMISFHPEGE